MSFRKPIGNRPAYIPSGGYAFPLPVRSVELDSEASISVRFVTDRRMFGYGYQRLMPDYFRSMPPRSGVFVSLCVPTPLVAPLAERPGDIDLLAVPYENDELVLDQTLAVELKVVRASFERPGRSPNEFGFSQAAALKALGFPFVAVGHLIVSDRSPRRAWLKTGVAKVLDEAGRAEMLPDRRVDRLPWMLTERSYGRMLNACPSPEFGLLSMFIRHAGSGLERTTGREGIWMPAGRPAVRNASPSRGILEAVANLIERYPRQWLDNPRYDPV